MGFSRQEYWSELPCPPLGDLPNTGMEPMSPAALALPVDSLLSEPPGKPSLYLGTIQTETVLINIFISYNIESHVSLDYTPSIN